MITHIIYHIPGRKVGCTKNLEYRIKNYISDEGSAPEIEILEELHDKTNQEAGDVEWQWADRFGYRRGPHYSTGGWLNISPEKKRERALKGGSAGGRRSFELGVGIHSKTHEQNLRSGYLSLELGLGIHALTTAQRQENGRRTAQISEVGFYKKDTCPHCGLFGNFVALRRWHFDNCPYNKSKVHFK
jgi:hypothetical protein